MSYKTDFSTVYHNNVNISTNKKGGAYSAPTSMSVPSLKRNVILLSACTVAVSKSVIHKAHNETIPKCRFAEKPCAASIFAKRKRLIVSDTLVSKLSAFFGADGGTRTRTPVRTRDFPATPYCYGRAGRVVVWTMSSPCRIFGLGGWYIVSTHLQRTLR